MTFLSPVSHLRLPVQAAISGCFKSDLQSNGRRFPEPGPVLTRQGSLHCPCLLVPEPLRFMRIFSRHSICMTFPSWITTSTEPYLIFPLAYRICCLVSKGSRLPGCSAAKYSSPKPSQKHVDRVMVVLADI